MSVIKKILIVSVFTAVGIAYSSISFAQSSTLIWRGRVNALPNVPAPSISSPDNCSYVDGQTLCDYSGPQASGAVNLPSGENFASSFDPNCSDGKLRIDADWLGLPEDLRVSVEYADGTQANFDHLTDPVAAFPMEVAISASGMITVKLSNFGSNTIAIREFGYEIGCQVQVTSSDIWVDFDVTGGTNGLKGMLIYPNFTLLNQKYIETVVVSYFYFDGDPLEPLKDFNDRYSTSNGYVSSAEFFTPDLIEFNSSNVGVFIPYEELHLADGHFELVFRIRFFDKKTKEPIDGLLPPPFKFWIVSESNGELISGGPIPPPTPVPPTPVPPTPVPTATPVPPATPIPTVSPFQILSPQDGSVLKCSPVFAWQDSIGLSSGHIYEIIFWQLGKEWQNEGRGATKADTRTSRIVDLNYLDDQSDWFAPGEYEWGILDITTDPYIRHALLSYGGRFTFVRDGTCP